MGKKILHICNGAQGNLFYKFLFEALEKHNIEQTIIAPVSKNNLVDYKHIKCEYFYRDTGIIARMRFYRKIKKLTKFTEEKIKIDSFDMIHAHTWFSDGAVAYNLHKKYNIPYIIAIRNTDIDVFYKYFLHVRKLGYTILENASQIIFISPAYENNVMNHLLPLKIKNKISGKLHIIPNGTSSFWLQNKFQKTAIFSHVKLLSIGSIIPRKNHLLLCRAVDLLRKKRINVELTIVGKGNKDSPSYRKKVDNYIKNKSYITLLEKQEQEILMKTYREHNIFVLLSHAETFGLVYIEALTQGLPIIYSKRQGIDGYFETGKIGYAVNSKNIKEITEAIVVAINNYSELISNIRLIDFSLFDWENIAKRYLEIYQIQKNS